MHDQEFERVLNDSVDELRRGRTASEIAAEHPDYQTELLKLLPLVAKLKKKKDIQPGQDWLRETRGMIAGLPAPRRLSPPNGLRRFERVATALAAGLILIFAGTFVVSRQLTPTRQPAMEDSASPFEAGARKTELPELEQAVQDVEDTLAELDSSGEELAEPELDFTIDP